MLHIACVDNIAASAYHLVRPHWPVTWHNGTPTAVYEAVTLGACDAALLPVGCLIELDHLVEPLGMFGIGCHGPVHSVQLFARAPLRSIVMGHVPIYATPHSQTSRRLLVSLCEMEFGKPPVLTANVDDAEGVLLIGGEALRQAHAQPGWPVRRDLGQWWRQRTGLSFVFARWVVNRGLDTAGREAVLSWLTQCVAFLKTAEGHAAATARMVHEAMPAQFTNPYFQNLDYALDGAHTAGQRRFLSLQCERRSWVANV